MYGDPACCRVPFSCGRGSYAYGCYILPGIFLFNRSGRQCFRGNALALVFSLGISAHKDQGVVSKRYQNLNMGRRPGADWAECTDFRYPKKRGLISGISDLRRKGVPYGTYGDLTPKNRALGPICSMSQVGIPEADRLGRFGRLGAGPPERFGRLGAAPPGRSGRVRVASTTREAPGKSSAGAVWCATWLVDIGWR